MPVIIEESEMRFGKYPDNSVFHLESSDQYTKSLRQNKVRSCEFVMLRKKKSRKRLIFVEAKRSLPEDYAADTEEKASTLYQEFIQEITEKFRHSLHLFSGILLGVQGQDGVPSDLLINDLKEYDFQIVLVVKTAKQERLIHYSDVLGQSLDRKSVV